MGYPAKTKPPTETKTITVAEIHDRGVKDTNGDNYFANGRDLASFQTGESYDVDFSSHVSKGGFPYKQIETFRHLTPYGHQPREPEAVATKVAQVVRQVQPTETPRPVAYNNNPGAAVMGMVNQYINRGDVPLNEDSIAQAIAICAAGYAKSKLGNAA